MSKFFEKKTTIKIKPLDRDIKVVYSNDIFKSRSKRSGKLGSINKGDFKHVDGCICCKGSRVFIFLSTKATKGTISHESYHAIMHLFKYIGVEQFDEEIVAYHLGFVVDEIFDRLKIYRKNNHENR